MAKARDREVRIYQETGIIADMAVARASHLRAWATDPQCPVRPSRDEMLSVADQLEGLAQLLQKLKQRCEWFSAQWSQAENILSEAAAHDDAKHLAHVLAWRILDQRPPELSTPAVPASAPPVADEGALVET